MAGVTVESVAAAGVVGAGGAGFPTHVKLSAQADTVVLNAAECEPLLHKDKEILRHFADQVLTGLAEAVRLVQAERGLIGIKGKYKDVIAELRPKLPANLELVELADIYPAGDEFTLVYNTTGRVIPPGGIPLHVGVVVMNVETALNVANSPSQPVTEKYLTVAGAVKEPVTLRVPIGVTLRECVEVAQPTVEPANYIVGGVMMGSLEENHDALVDKTTGGLIVLPDDHIAVQRRRRDWRQIARIGRSACDQCSFCTSLCPRWLLGHPIEPHRAMRSLGFSLTGEANVAGTVFCCECNLCSMYSCPEGLDPRSVCVQNKQRLLSEGKRWENPPFDPGRPERVMDGRRTPTSRLMQRLDLKRFRNVGPLRTDVELKPQRVGIKLKQHIGAPCEPVVQVGQTVRKGDVVGQPPVKDGKPALGAPVHASIDGVVTAVQDGVVWIERR